MTIRITLALLLLAIGSQAETPPLAALGFLAGDWVGTGSGTPGNGSGGFSLHYELGGKILVRKNHAEYPAAKDRPAFTHDDWTVVYPDGGQLRADYFDNEGHVIHYQVTVSISRDGKSAEFRSAVTASEPLYVLTYSSTSEGKIRLKFQIAPPGKPEALAAYIEAECTRIRVVN